MLNADGALARGVTAPTQGTLRVVKVNGVPDEIEGEDEALARLRSFGGAGWACYVSRVGTNGARIDVADGSQLPDGKVLWAELVNGAESLHLRYVGPRWHATHFERVPAGTEGATHWIFTHAMAREGGGELRYEVAWRMEDDAWRPWAARLAGVDPAGSDAYDADGSTDGDTGRPEGGA